MSDIVLYNISHYGYMFDMVLHSMKNHAGDETILLIDEGWLSGETNRFIHSVDSIPGFSKFIIYNEAPLRRGKPDPEKIAKFFDELLDKNGINIYKVTKVYSGFDTVHAFGIYLFQRQKHHVLFDTNMVTSTSPKDKMFEKSEYHRLMRECKALTWDSPYVDGVIYTLGSSFEDIIETMERGNHPYKKRQPASGKEISFSTKSVLLDALSEKELDTLIGFFKVPDLSGKPIKVLMMTSSFFMHSGNYKPTGLLTPTEEYVYPFRILVDAVFGGSANTVIKPHPNNEIPEEFRQTFFPGSIYVPGYIPSELMSRCNANFIMGMSPGSNSILTFKIDDIKTLPRSFFWNLSLFVNLFNLVKLAKDTGYEEVVCCDVKDEALLTGLNTMFDIEVSTYNAAVRYSHALFYFHKMTNYMAVNVIKDNIVVVNCDADIKSLERKPTYFLKTCVDQKSNFSVVKGDESAFAVYAEQKNAKIESYISTRYMEASGITIILRTIPEYELESQRYLESLRDDAYYRSVGNIQKCLEYLDARLPDVKNSPETAEELMYILARIVYDSRVKSSYKHSYANLLWKSPTASNLKEMVLLTKHLFEIDDPYAYRYAGWMYKTGKGYPKDIDKAIENYRKAVELKVPRVVYELAVALDEEGSESSRKECEVLLNQLCDSGDEKAKAMMNKRASSGHL